jgi:hypothetical protein
VSAEQAAIIVAVITTVGGLLGVVIQQFRKENREDHATVVENLRFIHKSIIRVDEKLDRHLESHANDYGKVSNGSKESAS